MLGVSVSTNLGSYFAQYSPLVMRRTKFGLGYVRCLTGRGVFLPLYPQEFGKHRSCNTLKIKVLAIFS